ncbi:hypothetical protein [Leptolyngbya phage Lbo-JY16]
MTDSELASLIRQSLLAVMEGQSIDGFPVIGAFQPTTQGRVPDGIYFNPFNDNRYGWQYRTDTYDELSGDQTHTESQWHESTFQVQGFARQNPADLTLPTAKDLTDTVAMLMQSQPFRQLLRDQGVGIQRVTQVRAPFFVNDNGNFEQNPSFDITFSHLRTLEQVTPSITKTEFNKTRV